jgi:hypothetical protein
MQVESTKKSPGAFSGNRCCKFAIPENYAAADGKEQRAKDKEQGAKGKEQRARSQIIVHMSFDISHLVICPMWHNRGILRNPH